MAGIQRASAVAYPIRQPVIENVLLKPEITMVRSRMPGSVAGQMCRAPSYTKYS